MFRTPCLYNSVTITQQKDIRKLQFLLCFLFLLLFFFFCLCLFPFFFCRYFCSFCSFYYFSCCRYSGIYIFSVFIFYFAVHFVLQDNSCISYFRDDINQTDCKRSGARAPKASSLSAEKRYVLIWESSTTHKIMQNH